MINIVKVTHFVKQFVKQPPLALPACLRSPVARPGGRARSWAARTNARLAVRARRPVAQAPKRRLLRWRRLRSALRENGVSLSLAHPFLHTKIDWR